jgi:hypothetical protein
MRLICQAQSQVSISRSSSSSIAISIVHNDVNGQVQNVVIESWNRPELNLKMKMVVNALILNLKLRLENCRLTSLDPNISSVNLKFNIKSQYPLWMHWRWSWSWDWYWSWRLSLKFFGIHNGSNGSSSFNLKFKFNIHCDWALRLVNYWMDFREYHLHW